MKTARTKKISAHTNQLPAGCLTQLGACRLTLTLALAVNKQPSAITGHHAKNTKHLKMDEEGASA